MKVARMVAAYTLCWAAVAWHVGAARAQQALQTPPATVPASQATAGESKWATRCAGLTRSGSLECAVEQSVVKADTRQVVTLFRVQVAGDTRAPVMVIQLPLGLYLPAGLGLQVDENKSVDLPVHTCDAGGCYVTSPVSAELLAQLQRGKTLHLRFQNLSKETIDVSMPLAGFATAYEGIK
jgi:invasion protein IalB